MATLITTKLREDALKLRRASKDSKLRSTLGSVKDEMMQEIHRILTIMLGPPPSPDKDITWEYYDKDDNFGTLTTSPLAFAGELSSKASVEANRGADVHELFSLVNDPRNTYGELLSVSRLGNVIGMRGIRYVNVDMDTMKTACIAMLKAELPIFFGSDVGKFSDSKSGIMDPGLIDYELGFDIRLGLTKAQRLKTGESAMTHAMVLTAVHLDGDGKPVRWRVQNSWGEGAGTKGWFVMSDKWMDEFVYQAVVDPKYASYSMMRNFTMLTRTRFVSKEIRDVLEKEPRMYVLPIPNGSRSKSLIHFIGYRYGILWEPWPELALRDLLRSGHFHSDELS